jgi:hypothetical protein
MVFLRRQLPLLITFVTGVVFALQYYVPHPVSEQVLTTVNKWLQIIGGFALVLGVTSLFHLHGSKIRRKEPGWGYSFVLYAGMLGTIAVGMVAFVSYRSSQVIHEPHGVGPPAQLVCVPPSTAKLSVTRRSLDTTSLVLPPRTFGSGS